MDSWHRRACSRLNCTPLVYAAVVALVLLIASAGWLRQHAGTIAAVTRDVLAALAVAAAWALVAGTLRLVTRQRRVARRHDVPDWMTSAAPPAPPAEEPEPGMLPAPQAAAPVPFPAASAHPAPERTEVTQ
jgi:hypothetical protein